MSQELTQDIVELLQRKLEHASAVTYWLDADLRIVHCNEAWDLFAAENDGRGLERRYQVGISVMDAVPTPLKRFYDDGYAKVLSSGQAWEHCYECSSPAVYRKIRMDVHQTPRGAGLVVVNSITVEQPYGESGRADGANDHGVYVDSLGVVTMCCHCRKTLRAGFLNVWDWVPMFVKDRPTVVTHGLCPICVNLHYPDFM